MAEITKEQKEKIRQLTRQANRRIERATPGQQKYLSQYVRRLTGGAEKFSSKYAGLTQQQAAAKIEKMERFLSHKMTTTRKGWEAIKNKGLKEAGKTWRDKKGYNITDEELADIIEQIDSSNHEEYYRAVNLVEAAKEEAGDDWKGTEEEILEAIRQKISGDEALEMALQAQEARKARKAKTEKAMKYRAREQHMREMGKKKRANSKLSGQGNKNK